MCCHILIGFSNRKAILKIIGRDSDRKIVLDTLDMLIAVCKQGIRNEKNRAKSQFGEIVGVETSYASGFVDAVREEMSKQCKALMLIIPKEVNEHIEKNYPNIGQSRTKYTIHYRIFCSEHKSEVKLKPHKTTSNGWIHICQFFLIHSDLNVVHWLMVTIERNITFTLNMFSYFYGLVSDNFSYR